MRRALQLVLAVLVGVPLLACPILLVSLPPHRAAAQEPPARVERIQTHDNRAPAGTLRDGVLTVRLEARTGRWHPEAEDGPGIDVQAFGEAGRPLQVPSPLIRVTEGTTIHAVVRNTLDATLVVYGLHTRPGKAEDTIHVPASGTREVRFVAGAPGTYIYWGSTTGRRMEERDGIDSQLSGAFVVDARGARTDDRVFVLGAWFEPPEGDGEPREVMTINGKGWPHTERFTFTVGDTVRWRWVNPTWSSHPMHLHGFYFRVDSRGAWAADTVYAPDARRLAVTELMFPGGTNAITWVPEREGNWLFHCHFPFHMSPGVSLGANAAHDEHGEHPMAGLVLGVHVNARPGEVASAPSREPRRLRLLVQSAPKRYGDAPGMGYVLQRGADVPAADSIQIPGPVLVLRRDEPVAITVVNRLAEPTTVHWHGMELESFPDGVPGWSGQPGRLLPAIAPADSFTAVFTPPRAGTFMYHPHQNELDQIASGLYGAMLVLAPGEEWDPDRDHVLVVGQAGPTVDSPGLVNGSATPPALELRVGETHRIRLVNITNDWRVMFTLASDSGFAQWRPVAKDGADLPPAHATLRPGHLVTGPGETADFEITPVRAGELRLEVKTQLSGWYVPVSIRVRERADSGS